MKIDVIPIKPEYSKFLELNPPVISNKVLPDWYKDMDIHDRYDHWASEFDIRHKPMNAKSCPAIQDILTTGIMIPAWSDIYIKTMRDTEGNIMTQHWDTTSRTAAQEPLQAHLNHHSFSQWEGMDLQVTINNKLLKILLPYYFKIPEGYNIFYTDPYYHFRKDIRCLSGIVEGDKWGAIAFPFEILQDDVHVKAGTPLIHALIYKREESKKIELNLREGTEQEYQDIKDMYFKRNIGYQGYK